MILLAMVSTFLLFHLHFTPDNLILSGGIALALVFGFFAFDEKIDLEDRIKGKGKYKHDDVLGRY